MEWAQAQAPQIRPPRLQTNCEWVYNENWLENDEPMYEQECDSHFEVDPIEMPEPSPQPLVDWFVGGMVSLLLDVPPEFFGVWLGTTFARRSGPGRQNL